MTTHSRRRQTTFSLQRELQISHSIDSENILGKCYCTQVAKNQFHNFKRELQLNSWKLTKVKTKNSINCYIKCADYRVETSWCLVEGYQRFWGAYYFHLQCWECWWPSIILRSITSQMTTYLITNGPLCTKSMLQMCSYLNYLRCD